MGQDAKRKTDDVFIVVVLLSIVLFVASLTQIAFITQKPDDPEYSSLFVFGLGWAGIYFNNRVVRTEFYRIAYHVTKKLVKLDRYAFYYRQAVGFYGYLLLLDEKVEILYDISQHIV